MSLAETYGQENATRFVAELERVEEELMPDGRAVEQAARITNQWGLDPHEQRLLAIELDFFKVRPRDYGRIGPDYDSRYSQAGDHLAFRGGEGFAEAGWRLRLGATVDDLQEALRPGYHRHAESMLYTIATGVHGLVFNVTHEDVLDTFGYCARKELFARQQRM